MVDLPLLLVPSSGPVAAHFSYGRGHPFRAGQRRTLGFAAAPGSRVVAACGGPVSFAGRVPGGGAVAVRCGRWSVSVGGLDRVGVRAGNAVAPGRPLGTAAGGGITLSVRRAGDRIGYVDPEPLLRAAPPARRFVPVGPAPRPRPLVRDPVRVVGPRRRPAPAPPAVPVVEPVGAPLPTPVRRPVEEAPPTPSLVWLGLVLAALGLPAARRGGRDRTARPGFGRGVAGGIGAVGAARPRLGDR